MPNDTGVVDASPTRRIVHLSYIDSDGKPRTDSYDIPAATTDAALNALTTALGPMTNASLWRIAVTNEFTTGVPTKADADDLTNDSVMDNIAILLKDGVNAFDFFIPANREAVTMVNGTENPDPNTDEFAELFAAIEGIWPATQPVSVRFSERKKKNRSVKL